MPYNIGGATLSSSMLTPDGIILPKTFRRVTNDMIDSVNNYNCTITSQGNDSTGGFFISYYFNNAGCGGPDSGLYCLIKSQYTWSRILCKFENGGTASCWGFNLDTHGNVSPNLLSYNTSQGDIIFRWDAINSFQNTSFAVQTNACDNDPSNFMHNSYSTGDPKTFYMFMRRNLNGNKSGFGHGRSCSGTGPVNYTTISEIYIL
jgi:hypothetical protein